MDHSRSTHLRDGDHPFEEEAGRIRGRLRAGFRRDDPVIAHHRVVDAVRQDLDPLVRDRVSLPPDVPPHGDELVDDSSNSCQYLAVGTAK